MSTEYLVCKAGNVTIGHGFPIVVQSMCNTDTLDVEASTAQCLSLWKCGCQMVRLTTQGLRQVESLGEIKKRMRAAGCDIPVVADVHFSADVALAAARGIADKVRINPGNFSRDHSVAMAKFKELIGICREYGTALRIGLNHGSLGERITSMYGDTPLGMVRAVMEWLQVCVDEKFTNVTVSLKASNPRVMIDAYRLLYKTMQEELGMIFPLHLGVTEAGGGVTGRIKSAVGIGTLLREGIGDTIRVSLTERPENEIPVAQLLASLATSENAYDNHHNLDLEAVSQEEFLVKASWIFGPDLMDRKIDDFELSATVAGHKLSDEEISSFKDDLMQACRRRFTKPEYIACPGCGRTLYNLEKLLKDVMDATSEFAGVKIAVMGCIVNGPGEMADADYGYVGEGGGKVTLYRGREVYARGIDQDEGVARLVELIRSDRN